MTIIISFQSEAEGLNSNTRDKREKELVQVKAFSTTQMVSAMRDNSETTFVMALVSSSSTKFRSIGESGSLMSFQVREKYEILQ